ncbi:MAG: hypothetical protein OEY65_05785 [Gammaproteobacteria bacterium]|nr:hypothetical protein [Gammaproteobacteria bacterium]
MLTRLYTLLTIVLFLLPLEGRLFAEEKIITGKFVVSFSAADNQKLWVVNALEQNIYNDLSGYARVVPFKKSTLENKQCKKRKIDCILNIYKKLNVDALMLGTVDGSDIDYETYDVQNKSLVESGSISIGRNSSLLKLRLGAFNAFKVFIEKGGILDKKQFKITADEKSDKAIRKSEQKDSDRKLKEQITIFLAIFTCFPYLLSLIGKPRRHPERSKIIIRWFYPFLIVSLSLIGYQYLLDAAGSGNIFNIILNLFDGYHWMLTGLSGLVWGYFVIINSKIIIPHLQGIERVKPYILFPLLQSTLITIIIKTAIIVSFYLGFFYGVYYLGNLLSIEHDAILILLLPLSGLYIIYWTALLLDVFSMSIDVKLAGIDLDYKSVWNLKIRKYFIANMKRNGATLNKRLVEDVVFLPGQNKGVVCYGGGFSRPRITIEKELIKFALGDIDDFNPEETVVFTKKVFDTAQRQNSLFKIIANFSDDIKKKKLFKSRHERKKLKNFENMQKYFERDLTVQKSNSFSSGNIMQGRILPGFDAKDEGLSLMSDNINDMLIIQSLLDENPDNNFRYDPDAEVDNASEDDKDFLFGALLHKFGELLRHEDVFSTIYFYLRFKKGAKRPQYNFIFSKYFAVVADTFVVLNFGLNHLMQHLYYEATKSPALLTQKEVSSEMLKSQDEILTRAKKAADKRKPRIIRTDELERIVWLSRFCQGSIQLQQGLNSRAKTIFKWSLSIGVTYLASLVLLNSYNYHPTYLQIIETEKQEIAEAIKKAQDKERKEK